MAVLEINFYCVKPQQTRDLYVSAASIIRTKTVTNPEPSPRGGFGGPCGQTEDTESDSDMGGETDGGRGHREAAELGWQLKRLNP